MNNQTPRNSLYLSSNETLQPPLDIGELLRAMVRELSTELDLYYEDDMADALRPSLDLIAKTVVYLDEEGLPVPDSAIHVLRRFGGSHH